MHFSFSEVEVDFCAVIHFIRLKQRFTVSMFWCEIHSTKFEALFLTFTFYIHIFYEPFHLHIN